MHSLSFAALATIMSILTAVGTVGGYWIGTKVGEERGATVALNYAADKLHNINNRS